MAVRDIYGRPYVILNSVPSIFAHALRLYMYVIHCAVNCFTIIVTALHGCCNYFAGSTPISIFIDSLAYISHYLLLSKCNWTMGLQNGVYR